MCPSWQVRLQTSTSFGTQSLRLVQASNVLVSDTRRRRRSELRGRQEDTEEKQKKEDYELLYVLLNIVSQSGW
jgi:hypothetical protein